MDPDRQQAVAKGLAAGDPRSWTALYECYYEPICRCIARMLYGKAHDVGDVVQETFLAAAKSARHFDPDKGSLWNWLYGIARHQTALHVRRRDRSERNGRLIGGQAELLEWLAGDESALPESMVRAELAEMVRDVLTELPNEYGAVLAARYLEEQPLEAIADTQDSTVTAVRSKLQRARQAFRQSFRRYVEGTPYAETGERHES